MGKMVNLRRTTEDDLDFILSAEHAPDNRAYVIGWTREQHSASLHNADILHQIIEDENGYAIGYVILAGISDYHQNIEFRRIVVTEKGRGFGRATVRAVKKLAFSELQAHRLWLDVVAGNARARQLYTTEGFVEEGTLRECLKVNEAWESLIIMSLLRHEFAA